MSEQELDTNLEQARDNVKFANTIEYYSKAMGTNVSTLAGDETTEEKLESINAMLTVCICKLVNDLHVLQERVSRLELYNE